MLEKVKTILNFFGHSPTMVDEKFLRWKWMHFRKIYKGRLSFFWSWRRFLGTSRLTKILEGTLVPKHCSVCLMDGMSCHNSFVVYLGLACFGIDILLCSSVAPVSLVRKQECEIWVCSLVVLPPMMLQKCSAKKVSVNLWFRLLLCHCRKFYFVCFFLSIWVVWRVRVWTMEHHFTVMAGGPLLP